MPHLSVIIATASPGPSLGPTLASVAANRLPDGWTGELVVVENGRARGAAEVLAALPPSALTRRCLLEPARGKSRALNRALAAQPGEIVLFTDDDVIVPPDWVERLSAPLRHGLADGVVGWVRLAPHLLRPWMSRHHRARLASTADYLDPRNPSEMIGANMGVSLAALCSVGGFDPELGPGVTNGGEESLLSWQLLRAGYRIVAEPAVEVEHHFSPSRLLYSSWVEAARLKGESRGYQLHHWHHQRLRFLGVRVLWLAAKLRLRRTLQTRSRGGAEGIAAWELSYREEIAAYRRYARELQRPRHYAPGGVRHCQPALSPA
jgi:cellulose synthase/poly-beta-1,6-N-acetylglucosamine synthase-like glycosyltransferase